MKTSRSRLVDMEAERGLLCALLQDTKLVGSINLDAADFFHPPHQQIYLALLALAARDALPKGMDSFPVVEEARSRGMLTVIGDGDVAAGENYIDHLLEEQPTPALAEEHAARIREKAFMRRVLEGVEDISTCINGGHTLDALIENGKALTELLAGGPAARNGHCPHLEGFLSSEHERVPVNWLWPGKIACGKINILAGDPGLGKSFISTDIAARITTGRPFPCEGHLGRNPGGVILLSEEDDHDDTIGPRFDVAGGNPSLLYLVSCIRQAGQEIPISIIDHIPLLEEALTKVENPQLIIIDPITSFMSSSKTKVDTHNNAEVRIALRAVTKMAARRKIAILCITHLNKGIGSALTRITGSIGFVALSRASYMVVKDKDNPDRRLMLPVKVNIAKDTIGLAYTLESTDTPVGDIARVAWEPEPVLKCADEALAQEHRSCPGPRPNTRSEAQNYLCSKLAAGPASANSCLLDRPSGVSERTLRRAKEELGIQSLKGNGGSWLWLLPGSGPLMEGHHEKSDEEEVPF